MHYLSPVHFLESLVLCRSFFIQNTFFYTNTYFLYTNTIILSFIQKALEIFLNYHIKKRWGYKHVADFKKKVFIYYRMWYRISLILAWRGLKKLS